MAELHYNTVTPLLLKALKTLMAAPDFYAFRLVGGTALSLYKGHRQSVDIDLFTDAPYQSIDFEAIDVFLRATYPHVEANDFREIGFGKSYYLGENENEIVKIDLFYTDAFVDTIEIIDDVRLATVEEIIAMKLSVVIRGGRKKDFWDIHELMDAYSPDEMFALHARRCPYEHEKENLKKNFTNFEIADGEPDPICLRGKHWELIKADTIDFIATLS